VDGDAEDIQKIIAAVEMHPSLSTLSFARDPRRARFPDGFTEGDLIHLLEVLPNTNVEHLSLAFNRIGDAGLELIASELHETKLKSLDLESASVNARGAEALAAVLAADKSELTSVNLSNNNVAGAAEALIRAATTHSKLTSIGDEGTSLGRTQSIDGHVLRTVLKGECAASHWSEWTTCAGECGAQSFITREREILSQPHKRHMKGKNCTLALSESRECIVRCKRGAAKTTLGNAALPQQATAAKKDASSPAVSKLVASDMPKSAPVVPAAASPAATSATTAATTAATSSSESPKIGDATAAPAAAAARVAAAPTAASPVTAAATPAASPVAAASAAVPAAAAPPEEQRATGPSQFSDTAAVPKRATDGAGGSGAVRERLTRFYAKYNPEKVSTVGEMLERFEGREDLLFKSLVSKYGPEP
jgi:hypothetical protein